MKSVNNLSDLISLVGKETLDKCFTEYMLLMIAKAEKFDILEEHLNNGNTDIEKLKEIINS